MTLIASVTPINFILLFEYEGCGYKSLLGEAVLIREIILRRIPHRRTEPSEVSVIVVE